jgi:hypothetical protein
MLTDKRIPFAPNINKEMSEIKKERQDKTNQCNSDLKLYSGFCREVSERNILVLPQSDIYEKDNKIGIEIKEQRKEYCFVSM